MLSRYFQDELAYLRESGRSFARRNPKLVNYLSDRATDPDVERLQEGFAFLTSRLREKLDDELPELYQSVTSLLWPNAMRPFPPVTLMRFQPMDRAITTKQVLPQGTEVFSQPVEGVKCQFQTTTDCSIYPLEIKGVELVRSREYSSLVCHLETLSGLSVSDTGIEDFKIWFCGDPHVSQALYLYCCRYLKRIHILDENGQRRNSIGKNSVSPGGLSFLESLLPNQTDAFYGYQLLQEYFVFPQKFHNINIDDLGRSLTGFHGSKVSFEFEFERPFPADIRVRDSNVELYCAPAVNLFPHDAEPMLVRHEKLHYLLRPSNVNRNAHEIFSIDEVASWKGAGGEKRGETLNVYSKFETFDHEVEREEGLTQIYYRLRLRPSITTTGLDHLLSFVRHDESFSAPRDESLSAKLTCYNGKMARELGVGDIDTVTEESPTFAYFSNLTRPTPPFLPSVDGRIYWNLISNLSLNYMSLLSKDALAAVISIYDLPSFADRQAERAAKKRSEGIVGIETKPFDRLFKGQSVRGLRTHLTLSESSFESEGDMFVFATVLAEFFRLYCSINSFHELHLTGQETGEVYQWSAKLGQQPLI